MTAARRAAEGRIRRPMVKAVAFALRASPLHVGVYVVLTVVSGFVPVVVAWQTKELFDALVSGEATRSRIVWLAAVLGLLSLVVALTPQLTRYLMTQARRRIGLLAQDQLFERVNRYGGLSRFEDPRFLDHLQMARTAGEFGPLVVTEGIFEVVRSIITTAGLALAVVTISPTFAGILLASAVPTIIAETLLARRRAVTGFRLSPTERREGFYAGLLMNVQAAKEIRLFGLGDLFRSRMRAEREVANRARQTLDRHTLSTQLGLALLASLVSGAGLVWAASAALAGELSIGSITMFVSAVGGVHLGLAGTATTTALAYQQSVEFRHFLHVVEADSDLAVPERPLPLPRLRSGIELRDVWFRYSPEHPWILSGVNVTIGHGQAVAVVGSNGAGKSTIVKLLCRMYDPTRGAILWDGVDIRDVPVEILRSRIRAVFQDYMEYELTAAENIGVGDVARLNDRDPIERAAGQAGIHETLKRLPRGYATMLSRIFREEENKSEDESGVRLSGGQWQRVALARAYLRADPEFLILDEPSSGLDAEAEHEIHEQLRRHRGDRASLLISHRLSAVRDADCIVVLDRGVVAERGSHAELMQLGGRYARFFTLQASRYQETSPELTVSATTSAD